jgi:GNAT superfamily N-acetyltransferase
MHYFEQLSPQTKNQFGPHRFDLSTLMYLFQATQDHIGYLLKVDDGIIGYSVVRRGYLAHDAPRLQAYGLTLSKKTDCNFAPSLADVYQGQGLGPQMFGDIRSDLKAAGFQRIFLWGGVQADNLRAVRYYKKLGFRSLGQFEHQGLNLDMALDL